MKMKGYAMLGIGRTGWIEKEVPVCGPNDALVRPIAVSLRVPRISTPSGRAPSACAAI